jgi:hypothetical protein
VPSAREAIIVNKLSYEGLNKLKEFFMSKKLFLSAMLAMVLVFGMAVIGCDNDPKDEGDTWSNVTSLNQVNGTWKGSYTDTQTQEGITVRTVAEITMTVNASAGTASGSVKMTMTFSGGSINTYWPMIKEGFDVSDGWTINDATHSVSMTEAMPSEQISLSDMDGVKINQNGTKLKQPASGDSPEIIFIKQ